MSTNTSIETNSQGGKGSVTEGGFHLGFPARGVLTVAAVVKEGAARYEINNWRLVTPEEHYNHAVEHLMLLGDPMDPSNDRQSTAYEDHAAHAACRMLMFLETRKVDRPLAFHVVPTPSKPGPLAAIAAKPNAPELLRQLAQAAAKAKPEPCEIRRTTPFPIQHPQLGRLYAGGMYPQPDNAYDALEAHGIQ